MLRDFESRLADVLGSRLPAPLAGSVDVSPGRAIARVVLGVTSVQRIDDELLSLRSERVPGDAAPRQVAKLRCTIEIDMKVPTNGGRADQMLAIDTLLYLLEDSSMRDGSALLPGDNSDPGFFIRSMTMSGSIPPQSLTLEAEGFFWPVGTAGQQGPQIQHARIRSALLPLTVDPQPSHLVAGSPAQTFTITMAATGTTIVNADDVQTAAYGSLVVTLVDAGGRPGQGTLSGGASGSAGARIVTVSNGAASINYTPPAQPATEFFVVKLDDGADDPGIELGRFLLRVRSS